MKTNLTQQHKVKSSVLNISQCNCILFLVWILYYWPRDDKIRL